MEIGQIRKMVREQGINYALTEIEFYYASRPIKSNTVYNHLSDREKAINYYMSTVKNSQKAI